MKALFETAFLKLRKSLTFSPQNEFSSLLREEEMNGFLAKKIKTDTHLKNNTKQEEGREKEKKKKNYASSTSVWVLREEGVGDEQHLNVDDGCDGRSIFFVFAEKKLSRRRVSVVVDSRRTTVSTIASIDGSFCNIFIIVFCFCFVGREDETDVYFFFLG